VLRRVARDVLVRPTTHRPGATAQARHRVDQLGLAVAVDPAMPTISPARTSNETPRTFSMPRSSKTCRSSTASSGSPAAPALVDAQQHLAADHQPREALLGRALGGSVSISLPRRRHR
jgi:hypothetical protein